MKKEVLLAIGVGFGLGLVITFGIWTANKSLKQAKVVPTPTPLSTPLGASPSPVPTSQLVVDTPEDESISAVASITVSGKSTPNAVISIIFEEDETIIEADDKGEFSTKINLIGGYNTIIISDQENTETRIVTYSTTKI